MMRCCQCGQAAHTRSSYEISVTTKERYYQCVNINCSHTFVSHETYVRTIGSPNIVNQAPLHPSKEQKLLAF